MINVKKKQIRRTPSGDYCMVLYINRRLDPENDSCIILDENGALRKELNKVVDTWILISDPDVEHKCDLFLKEVFENLKDKYMIGINKDIWSLIDKLRIRKKIKTNKDLKDQ